MTPHLNTPDAEAGFLDGGQAAAAVYGPKHPAGRGARVREHAARLRVASRAGAHCSMELSPWANSTTCSKSG